MCMERYEGNRMHVLRTPRVPFISRARECSYMYPVMSIHLSAWLFIKITAMGDWLYHLGSIPGKLGSVGFMKYLQKCNASLQFHVTSGTFCCNCIFHSSYNKSQIHSFTPINSVDYRMKTEKRSHCQKSKWKFKVTLSTHFERIS